MSQPSSAFDLSNLDHARACMHDAFLQAQPPLTDALRLFVQLAFRPLPPRSPADEVRDRLEGKMRAHFVEVSFRSDGVRALLAALTSQFRQAGPWDIFFIFEVVLRCQGLFLDTCGVTEHVRRAHLKQQLKAVFVARNWFAGHGSCKLNDISGALIALQSVLHTFTNLPSCDSTLRSCLQTTAAAVGQLLQRVMHAGDFSTSMQASSIAFVHASRAFEYVDVAASTVAGKHFDSFEKAALELKAFASRGSFTQPEATVFNAHVDVVCTVRNRVFHSTRGITASMMDAVHAAAELLRMMGRVEESKELASIRSSFLSAFAGSSFAEPLAKEAASAVCHVAQHCPFIIRASFADYASDGSSCVRVPIIGHVLKGSLKAPGIQPCDCVKQLAKDAVGPISKALTPLCEAAKRLPVFYSLDADGLRSAVTRDGADLLLFRSCGRSIVAALPGGHQCSGDSRIQFTDDDDGHILAVQHFIVCKLRHGSYDAACACVAGIGGIIRDDCGSTANMATKDVMKKGWLSLKSDQRVPLLPANASSADTDAFLHLVECDTVHKAMKATAPCVLPVSVKHSVQVGVQAFVDRFSGDMLVDREVQIAAAAAVLQAVADGTAVSGSMSIALICGAPGTGKSHCGEEVLFRLSKVQVDGSCMEKVTCRSAAAVNSGLVQLGRRMGKTLGVGPDSPALDVLSALHKHLATSPCVPITRLLCQRWSAIVFMV